MDLLMLNLDEPSVLVTLTVARYSPRPATRVSHGRTPQNSRICKSGRRIHVSCNYGTEMAHPGRRLLRGTGNNDRDDAYGLLPSAPPVSGTSDHVHAYACACRRSDWARARVVW